MLSHLKSASEMYGLISKRGEEIALSKKWPIFNVSASKVKAVYLSFEKPSIWLWHYSLPASINFSLKVS